MTNAEIIEALELACRQLVRDRVGFSHYGIDRGAEIDRTSDAIEQQCREAAVALRAQQEPSIHELGKRYGDFATQHIALACGAVCWNGTAWERQCEREPQG